MAAWFPTSKTFPTPVALPTPVYPSGATYARPGFYVFEGDSLSSDNLDGIRPWPQEFLALVPYLGSLSFNRAKSGERIEQMLPEFTADLQTEYLTYATAKNVYYFLFAGVNDIVVRESAAIQVDLAAYWTAVNVLGFRLVASTLGPVSSWPGSAPALETKRLAINAYIRTQTGIFYALMEPDVWMPDANNATYYRDGQHYTQAGATLFAQRVALLIPTP